jgi:DNA helicase II / ATP-dependent DNA helicase PcrA
MPNQLGGDVLSNGTPRGTAASEPDTSAETTRDGAPTGVVNYTTSQLAAIATIDQNLQIVACAGAGKTDVVAERVVRILEKKVPEGIRPRNIVAFTFTERAGAELKDRISTKVRRTLGDIHGMAEMYVGTIHGYCLQLLQSHLPEYFKFSVLTEVQARLLVDRASRKSGLSDLGLRRWVESRLFLEVLGVLREADLDESKLEGHQAKAALEQYQQYLESKRYLDYTEILLQAVRALVQEDDLRTKIAEQVRYLIVDEYQDVNPLQEALISVMHELGANLCVVGDDDQTIYQWRGSNVQNILSFAERYNDVRRISIEENYRSSQGVVEAARLVVEANNPARLQKTMVSAGFHDYDRGDLLCISHASPTDEAEWIARKARSMIGTPIVDRPGGEPRGLAPSDIAVLLRTVRGTGSAIVNALRDQGLPVVVIGMRGLFETTEVQAAVALYNYMVRRIEAEDLKEVWITADLGIDPERLIGATSLMAQQREWTEPKGWATYSLQRTFLDFLEELAMREEDVPGGRGEVAYYNLGKFSQVISDYEQIHFMTNPQSKYEGFADFLRYQAADYYPEGWQDAAYVRPDAVQVMTIHQAKGMEWPIVFVPCLQRNRFPGKKHGGKNRWHVIPRNSVRNADGYDGSIEDERRLFYVALTRSKKYLFCSWAPDPTNKLYRRPSQFVTEFTACPRVLTSEPSLTTLPKLPPRPRRQIANVALSFSELKYFFECPYQFKLRFLYGFNPPLVEKLGYGKSLHDALAEIHKRALDGDIVSESEATSLLDRHLNLPFAHSQLREDLRASGVKALTSYLERNAHQLHKTEHVEQVVEINLGDGLVVNGRIDLIRRTDTREIFVVDFKSSERAQEEDVSRTQLHIYSLGFRELTGKSADFIEIYNLDQKGVVQREEVSRALEDATKQEMVSAGSSLRANDLKRLPVWDPKCEKCDMVGICRTRQAG